MAVVGAEDEVGVVGGKGAVMPNTEAGAVMAVATKGWERRRQGRR